MARNGGGDAVKRGRSRFHYIMAASAVDMHVNKAGNDGHAGSDVVHGAFWDFHFVAMTDCGDAAAFNENNGVEKLLLRSEDAARINSGDGHSLRIVLELRGKDTGEPCIIFLLRYNQMSPISRRALNGK